MCNKCHNELVNALLEIPTIENFATRTDLLLGIPNSQNFDRPKDSARTDLSQTVKALVGLTAKAGKKPLKIFIDNARLRVADYTLSDQLEKLRLQYEQCLSQHEEQPNQERTAPQQQSPGPDPAASKKKTSASGDEHVKSGPERNPCSSLESFKQVVTDMERSLDIVPAFQFPISVLTKYVDELTEVIKTLRGASKEERNCLCSKDSVLHHIREARNELGIAIDQQHRTKGISRQFINSLNSCRNHLADSLMCW